jgi:heme A synthase
MYTAFLIVHSWVRWLALIAGIVATIAAIVDRGAREKSAADRWGLVLTIALDIQLLVGLLLYFVVSPNMAEIRAHFGEAMRIGQLRFWAVEHATAMLIAVVLAHVGRVLARRAPTPASKRTRSIVCFGLATILMIVGMPWPGMAAGRPLLRL